MTRGARRRPGGLTLPLAAAAAALLAIATYRELGFRAERQQAQAVIAALRQNLANSRGELAGAQGELATAEAALARAEAALSVVRQRDLRLISLRAAGDAAPAVGHVLLGPATRQALFYAFDLSPLPDDRIYALWWITAKAGPVRAAIFTPDARGVARADATLPADAGAIQAATVTLERAGGVDQPLGPTVLRGALDPS